MRGLFLMLVRSDCTNYFCPGSYTMGSSKHKRSKTVQKTTGSTVVTGKASDTKERRSLVIWVVLYYLAVISMAAAIAFSGLGERTLWSDEAQVALFAKNYVKTGKLTGWDGRNLYSERNGSLLRKDFSPRNPPLDFLVATAAFRLFGVSTLTSRFFFALFGVAGLGMFAWLLHELFGLRSIFALYSFPLLCLSTQLLLYIRQCRYYAPAIFLSLASLVFFARMVKPREAGRGIHLDGKPEIRRTTTAALDTAFLVLSLAGLFFASPLLCSAFVFSLEAVFVFRHRKTVVAFPVWLIPAGFAAFCLLTLPYAISQRVWERPDMVLHASIIDKLTLFVYQIRDMDLCVFFPMVFLIAFVVLLAVRPLRRLIPPATIDAFCLMLLYISAVSLLSREPITWQGITGGQADVRYLILIFPCCALITGTMLALIHRKLNRWIAIACTAVIVLTNVPTIRSLSGHFDLPLPGLIQEVTTRFRSPINEVEEYLDKNENTDELLFIIPEYYIPGMIFYLGDRFRIGSTLDRTSKLDVSELEKQGHLLYTDQYAPDRIISFRLLSETRRILKIFHRDSLVYVQRAVSASPGLDETRPELGYHRFAPKKYMSIKDAIWILEPKETNRLTAADSQFCRLTQQF